MTDKPTHTRFDCHMHTPLCGHAIGNPVEYVEAAAAEGISLVTFTCHIPMRDDQFAQKGIRMNLSDLPRYREMVREAQEHGKEVGVEVLYGIEAEIFPDEEIMQDMEKVLRNEPFDFVLGSLHHMLPAFQSWLQEQKMQTDAEKVAGYFHCLSEGARSGRYHSLAHPDVIRIYGTLQKPFNPEEHEAPILNFLNVVADSGTCLEINTSGLIKGDCVAHPDPLILKWALDRDIPFTIGSDSHTPNMVGQYFSHVLVQFRNLGLRELHYFRKGQRIQVPL
ncbi:MAG: histidinol-phosphatase [Opitutales bacterium]|jgi:histidinol-phosphatase (PHP family)